MNKGENYDVVNVARIVVLSAVLGLSAAFAPEPRLLAILGAAVALSIAWYAWERLGLLPPAEHPKTTYVPTFLDLATLTLLAYFTGGLGSFVIGGHYFSIAIGSTNKRINHGLFALSISFAMLAAMGALELLGIAAPIDALGRTVPLTPSRMAFTLACWLSVGTALHLVIRRLRMEELALERRLRDSELRYGMLADSSRDQDETIKLLLGGSGGGSEDCIWETDAEGRFRKYPETMPSRLGKPGHSFIGTGMVEALAGAAPTDEPGVKERLDRLSEALAKREPFGELLVRLGSAREPRFWSLAGRPRLEADGAPSGWRIAGRDVTRSALHSEELERLAWIDQPTGLGNRADFLRRMDAYFAAGRPASPGVAESGPALLALIHIENMKLVNGVFGHAMGDEAIGVFARRVKFICSEFGGVPHRLDGADFSIFISPSGPSTAEDLDNSMQILREPVVLASQTIELEVRIGAAATGPDSDSAESLLQAAEGALNHARAAKLSQTKRFDSEMAASERRGKEMLSEIQDAMDRKEFRLLYQPQVFASTGGLAGAESLVRWHNQRLGLVSPGEFIPLAEKNGYIISLGAWIQYQACKDAALWPKPWRVAVNVAAAQLLNRNFNRSVLQILENSGLAPERLKLEITESSFVAESGQAREQLELLRAEGIRIALDDFGTGYSSLSYLKDLPIDELKIDQSFVRALGDDGGSAAIVETIIKLAKNLGLSVTAEGAEAEAQAAVLRDLGCDYIQGYLYSKPIPSDQLAEFGLSRAERGPLLEAPLRDL